MFNVYFIKEIFKNEKDVFSGHIFCLHSGEKGHVAAPLILKGKRFASLT